MTTLKFKRLRRSSIASSVCVADIRHIYSGRNRVLHCALLMMGKDAVENSGIGAAIGRSWSRYSMALTDCYRILMVHMGGYELCTGMLLLL